MKKPPQHALVVGLTGNIGSGKSAVAEILHTLGAHIIDADLLAREIVAPGTPALAEIKKTFGPETLLPSGELNRKKLGEIIFQNDSKRNVLEKITHPKIRELFLNTLKVAMRKHAIIVYVVPLLFESGFPYDELEKIIVVTAPFEASIERIVKRDSCSPELAIQKFKSQIDPNIKTAKADFVIANDGNLEQLRAQVAELYGKLMVLQQRSKDR